jgi:magnesium-transporting ATPase (P-type)
MSRLDAERFPHRYDGCRAMSDRHDFETDGRIRIRTAAGGRRARAAKDAGTPPGDRAGMVSMNTSVTRGAGEFVATATGMSTETPGSASAINSDKTGTRALDQMTAVQMIAAGRRHAVEGKGCSAPPWPCRSRRPPRSGQRCRGGRP